MSLQNLPTTRIKVAIIGAGPSGLGTAIEFAKLQYVDWTIYEQATVIREIGAGISIQPTTWRMLKVMGADGNLVPKDFYRPADNHSVQHR
jgi:salicylate hydroxylase